MFKSVKNRIIASVLCSTIFVGMLAFANFSNRCEEVRDSVFRLHIIANSDNEEDQRLKLKVRDALLAASEDYFSACKTRDDSAKEAEMHIKDFENIASEVISQNGYDYGVEASVGTAFFGTRSYDDFTLPAGEYEALRVVIGEGRGKNWWCVMFPAVCLPSATDSKIEDALTESGAEIVKNEVKFKASFKCVEWYENIKAYFKG